MVVVVKKQFVKQLQILPKNVKEAILATIDILHKAKNLQATNLQYKKLEGQKRGESYYRIKVGNYRIGCELRIPEIIIITIFHRQDNYKSFPPK